MSDIKAGQGPAPKTEAPQISEVLKLLWAKISFRHLAFAAGLHAFVSYGASTWNAPFFIRIHNMSSTDLGAALALVAGIGAIGTFLVATCLTSYLTAPVTSAGIFGFPASPRSSWCHSSLLLICMTASVQPSQACAWWQSWAAFIWAHPSP
jgi:hypothetical protein